MSTERKFIYIHVPKTGGNSIQTALAPFSDDKKTLNPNQDGIDRFNITGPITRNKHDALAAYKAALPDFSAYYSFFSARHPFNRAVSAYFSPSNWVRPNADGVAEIAPPIWNYGEFLRFVGRMRPIVSYITIDETIYPVNDRLKLESIDTDFERVKQALRIPSIAALGHVNRTADRHGRVEIILEDRALRRIVEDQFVEDMNYLGY